MMKETVDLDLYTSLEVAKEEVWRRWNDAALGGKIADFVGTVPSPFTIQPRAHLARSIATPNNELFRFLELM